MSSLCHDCLVDTFNPPHSEFYMVLQDVWDEATNKNEMIKFLCIGCLENRLGRILTPYDFAVVPLNFMLTGYSSKRLLDRVGDRFEKQNAFNLLIDNWQ